MTGLSSFPISGVQSPRFASRLDGKREPKGWLEDHLNAMHPVTDTFKRMESARESRIGTLADRLLAISPGYRVRRDYQKAETGLLRVLDERGLSKNGGLSSAYWQAFHLPGQLFLSALNAEHLETADLKQLTGFIQEEYLPLMQSVQSDADWWTLDWTLKGLGDTFPSDQPQAGMARLNETVRTLRRHLEARSASWRMLQEVVSQTHQRFNDAFYHPSTREIVAEDPAHLRIPLPRVREQAYRAERRRFVADVLLPWMAVVAQLPAAHPETAGFDARAFLAQTLTLGGDTQGLPRLILTAEEGSGGDPIALGQSARDALLLLWRLTALQADLEAQVTDSSPIRQALDRLAVSESAPRLKDGEHPIYITHDDVFNMIPEAVWEASGKQR